MQGIIRRVNGMILVQCMNGKELKGSGRRWSGVKAYSTRRSINLVQNPSGPLDTD